MRFSIWPSARRPWGEIVELTRHCEATGWDGVYVADHFMPHGGFTPDVDQEAPLDGDTLECWSVLVTDAPNQPAPVQPRLPLLIGGGGEKRTMRIAARFADEWNVWSTTDVLADKVRVLHAHCDALGRDPAELRVSTQAPLFLSTDPAWVAKTRAGAPSRAIVGTPAEVTDVVGRYREAGAHELIVPDATLGPLGACKETCDLFIEEVATHFPEEPDE